MYKRVLLIFIFVLLNSTNLQANSQCKNSPMWEMIKKTDISVQYYYDNDLLILPQPSVIKNTIPYLIVKGPDMKFFSIVGHNQFKKFNGNNFEKWTGKYDSSDWKTAYAIYKTVTKELPRGEYIIYTLNVPSGSKILGCNFKKWWIDRAIKIKIRDLHGKYYLDSTVELPHICDSTGATVSTGDLNCGEDVNKVAMIKIQLESAKDYKAKGKFKKAEKELKKAKISVKKELKKIKIQRNKYSKFDKYSVYSDNSITASFQHDISKLNDLASKLSKHSSQKEKEKFINMKERFDKKVVDTLTEIAKSRLIELSRIDVIKSKLDDLSIKLDINSKKTSQSNTQKQINKNDISSLSRNLETNFGLDDTANFLKKMDKFINDINKNCYIMMSKLFTLGEETSINFASAIFGILSDMAKNKAGINEIKSDEKEKAILDFMRIISDLQKLFSGDFLKISKIIQDKIPEAVVDKAINSQVTK